MFWGKKTFRRMTNHSSQGQEVRGEARASNGWVCLNAAIVEASLISRSSLFHSDKQ